jgi:hypothetical protein
MSMKKIFLKLSSSPYREVLLFTIPLMLLIFVLIYNILNEGSQQFSLLAQAFLHGQLNFLKPIGGLGQDPIFYHGKIYWGDGPFPAILLMPLFAFFSIFHVFFYQGYIDWLLILGIIFLVFKFARWLDYTLEDSFLLTSGFVFASVFVGVTIASSSWFFAQVLTTFLLFWGMYEFFIRKTKRWWLYGLITGLIMLTRLTASPILILFLLGLWQDKTTRTAKLKNLAQLMVPVAIAILLIGLYNYLRFQSPFNGGFSHQLLHSYSAESRALGEFGLIHLPSNLYSLILRGPIPELRNSTSWTLKFPYLSNNELGMSIFITSPYFLTLFFYKWSSFDRRARQLLFTALGSAFFVLTYFGLGPEQFGYRYSLDFLPELYLVFMIMYRKHHKNLSSGMRILILGSQLVNLFFVISLIHSV